GKSYHVDLLGGFRYLELDDLLDIRQQLDVLPAVPVLGGTSTFAFDHFGTRNQFYGGQLGAEAEFHRGPWFVDLWAKAAFGFTNGVVTIHGTALARGPLGGTVGLPAGPLTLPSNTGRHSRDAFAVVPEAGVNVGCALTQHVRAFVGYTFLYASDVLRAG